MPGPTEDDGYVELNADELKAERILGIAMGFMNIDHPITSKQVSEAFYPDDEGDAFKRKFLRDRDQLASCGIVIRQAGEREGDALWQLDAASSYPSAERLPVRQAAVIELACRPLLSDPTFPYTEALATALAKVVGSFDGVRPGRPAELMRQGPIMRTLRRCLAQRRLVRVSYLDAKGSKSERELAAYGFFGLRGRMYLVAADAANMGMPPKTFRCDRVRKATEVRGSSYEIPDDFDVDDFMLLPFQIGPAVCAATFVVPDGRIHDLRHDSLGKGTLERRGDEWRWRVGVSDIDGAAAWAISEGIRPKAPQELVLAWREALEGVIAHA